MENQMYVGVYQLDNGNWGYRFTQTVDGKRKNHKSIKDANGRPMKSQKSAFKARQSAMLATTTQEPPAPQQYFTVQEVYNEYCLNGRKGKAFQTIRKQDSLWNNHLSSAFGSRIIDDISVAEINDYLSRLYYKDGRAYSYVEAFLKMFYLIWGQAYSRNYIDISVYNRTCVNKDCRISMPKMKIDDDTDIVVYSRDEISMLDEYFSGTNAETAYLLGRYCGLRISECYGLKWENIDIEKGTITIDRQMQYQDGLIKLVPLKTRNAKRTIYMSKPLKEYFVKLERERNVDTVNLTAVRAQNAVCIPDVGGTELSSLALVNTLPNGKIQTVNSMKYHSRMVKERLSIEFKFHHLRHTYGTRLAELNTPTHILCNQMGHASGKVTERYYLGVTKTGVDLLIDNLNCI